MAILNNSNAISSGGGGYDINNSLRFRNSASAYLNRTPASSGSQTTWTWSAWVKRGKLASSGTLFAEYNANSDAGYSTLYFNTDDTFNFTGFYTTYLVTTQVFRDPSAWYHIVLAVDTTQATSTNRIKLYVNGVQVTAFTTANYPALNATFSINNTGTHYLGFDGFGSSGYLDGYLAEVNFVNAQQLTPSSFGETDTTTGSWLPKAYSGTYGTNGFYLKFSDIATTSGSNAGLGKDFSGNANYWTTNNISVTAGTTYDAMLDVPTNTSATVANYAVMSPINISGMTLSEANLKVSQTATAQGCRSTIAMTSGKWYWEITNTTGSVHDNIGITPDTTPLTTDLTVAGSNAIVYSAFAGQKGINGTFSTYGATYTTNDIIGVAVDIDNNTVTYYKNNTSQGAITGLSLSGFTWYAVNTNANNISNVKAYNFGQRPFSYTPPTGFVSINTYNLPDSTIKKGNTVMDATLYSGNGATRSITNDGAFKPDFVWIKARSIAYFHRLVDSVRGTGKELYSNDTGAETTNQADGYVSAFNSNGFSILGGAGVNGSGNTYVAWQWQAGQGSSSSNTQGSITSTVSVNATAGFSIVTYTGTGANATVGHGLGVAPKMLIVKSRSAAVNWVVYNASLGNTGSLYLNLTNSFTTVATWNNTSPTPSVFSVNGTGYYVNDSAATYVAYCWAEIAGFSKFGSYTGNGSTDGPFVYTGFRPKFIMYKRTDSTGSWGIFDTSRNTYNLSTNVLYANLSSAEYTSTGAGFDNIDILSNGFKPRQSNSGVNASGGTYIYMAFAENPFKSSLAR